MHEIYPTSAGLSLLLLAACSPGSGDPNDGVDSGSLSDKSSSNGDNGEGTGSGSGSQIDFGNGTDEMDMPHSDGPQGCASERADTNPLPVELMLLLDQSGSMTLDSPNRWDPVTSAMKGFINDPNLRDLRIGLQYFPQGASRTEDPAICRSTAYLAPDVAMTEMPAARTLISDSIDAHYFTAAEGRDPAHWGTPTRPALEGTYEYLRGWATENPGSTPLLILATDGRPSKLCYDESDDLDGIEEITSAIAGAAAQSPAIRTYVIGIGEIDRLEEWAQAGGTGEGAFVVDAGDPERTRTEFSAAMNAIRAAEAPCRYEIPPPMGGFIDFNKVNVEFNFPSTDPQLLGQVANEAGCTAGLDWYYDDPAAPKQLNLCPQACQNLNAGGGSLEIVFGCTTNVR